MHASFKSIEKSMILAINIPLCHTAILYQNKKIEWSQETFPHIFRMYVKMQLHT